MSTNRYYLAGGVAVAAVLAIAVILTVTLTRAEPHPKSATPTAAPSATPSDTPWWEQSPTPDPRFPARVTDAWLSDKADTAEARRVSLDGTSLPKPATGLTYAFVTVEVQNKSDAPINAGYGATATDDAGKVYDSADDVYNTYNSDTANPGGTLRHTAVFLVPEGVKPTNVLLQVGTSGDDIVEVSARTP